MVGIFWSLLDLERIDVVMPTVLVDVVIGKLAFLLLKKKIAMVG